MPHEEPHHEECRVSPHHHLDAPAVQREHHADEQRAEHRCAAKIDAAAPAAHDVLRQDGAERTKGGGDAEHTQQHGTAQPLLGYRYNNKFLGYKRQPEHQRERHKGGKTHHLAQHPQLALTVVLKVGEHGLRHLRHHALHQRSALLAPVVGGVIDANVMLREVASQQDVHYVDVDALHDGGYQHLHREAEHALDGAEVEVERGPPRTVVPVHKHINADEHQSLGGERPVGKSLPRHHDAHDARQQYRRHCRLCLLLGAQVLEKPCRLCRVEAREDYAQEGVAAEPCQFGGVVVFRYQRCTEEEQGVHRQSHQYIEPEHGIVVAVCWLLDVHQSGAETAVLQHRSHLREDGYDGHHAVVLRRQQAQRDDAEDESQQLLHSVVHPSPEQSFRGFFL